MVERYRARVKLTPEEQQVYRPSKGIDIIWIPTDNPDVWDAIFVGSDLYPEQEWQKTAADIRHDILNSLRGRILAENLGPFPQEPQRILKIETFLDHPNVTLQSSGAHKELRKAAEAATEVHDVEMTKEQFESLEQPRSGAKLEPREIRRKRRTIRNVRADGHTEVVETGPTEEKYVMPFGIIDVG